MEEGEEDRQHRSKKHHEHVRSNEYMKVPNGSTLDSGKFSVTVTGELVPIVQVTLPEDDYIYFEHHTILAKDTTVGVSMMKLKGLTKRIFAGLPLLQIKASGPGEISLSHNGVGEVIALEIRDHEIDVQQHHFLFATSGVTYGYTALRGFKNIFGGAATTYFMDRFSGRGLLALHGFGNVVVRTLESGESVDIEPSAWLFKDSSVQMNTFSTRLTAGLLGGTFLWMTRFTGPGRIAYESLSILE